MAGMGMGLGWLLVLLMAPKKRQKRASRAEEAEGAGEEPEQEKQKRRRRRSRWWQFTKTTVQSPQVGKGWTHSVHPPGHAWKDFLWKPHPQAELWHSGRHASSGGAGATAKAQRRGVWMWRAWTCLCGRHFQEPGHWHVPAALASSQDWDAFLFLVFLLWATYESSVRKAFNFFAALPPPPGHVFGATQRGTSSSMESRSLQGAPLTRCRNSFAYITKPIQWQLHCKKNNQVPCCHSGSSTGGPWHWDCPCWAVWVQNPIAIISEHLQHGWRHEGRCSFRPWASRERQFHAYIHRILPGMVSANDPYHWGTLELRQEGRAASEVGKVVQAYSPLSHLDQSLWWIWAPNAYHHEGPQGAKGWTLDLGGCNGSPCWQASSKPLKPKQNHRVNGTGT